MLSPKPQTAKLFVYLNIEPASMRALINLVLILGQSKRKLVASEASDNFRKAKPKI
jgi:hypothetical protein